ATVATTIDLGADVVTQKTGPASIVAGTSISYVITSSNNGPKDAANVIITDSLLPGLTGVSVSDGGTYDPVTGEITFPTIPTLVSTLTGGPTETRRISFAPPSTLTSFTNTVRSSSPTPDPNADNNNGSITAAPNQPGGRVITTLVPGADVVTQKTAPATINSGEQLTYRITTTNLGTVPAANVAITDSLIPGLTNVIVSNDGSYDTATGRVTFPPILSLGVGVTQVRTISFVPPPTLTQITNIVSSRSDTPDPRPENNDGSTVADPNQPGGRVTTVIGTAADVSTTKSGLTSAAAGQSVSYTITTSNTGPGAAANVVITDSIVPGLTGVSASDGGSYDPITGVVTFQPIATLANGASVTRTVSLRMPDTGSITNTSRSTSSTGDPNPNNNNGTSSTAIVTTSVVPGADLVTVKSGLTSATAGSSITYTITTVNNGPNDAQDVVITDSIVPGLTGVTATGGGSYDPATGIVTFPSIPTLLSGDNATRQVTLIAPASGSIRNTARSNSPTADPNPLNNNGSAPGATVTTTITATPPNNVPPLADNSNATLPPNSAVRLTGLGGSDPDGTVASFTIDTLPPVAQGVLFLGDPASGGVRVTAGQVLTPAQLSQLFFQSTSGFTGTTFTYSAVDNLGLSSPAAATVAANPLGNQPPVANNSNAAIAPGSTVPINGLGGTDPDGTIASYTINTLPPSAQGVLFLGDPALGGVAVSAGQVLTPAQIGQLFFQSTGTFAGTNFTYSATDNRGATSPGTVTFTANAVVNQPPVANNASVSAVPGSTVPVNGLGGSDPDGTIASYTIDTLPPAAQGVLFLGDPANGGTAVTVGQSLTPAQIGQLFFQSAGTFTGTSFTYSAVDNLGLSSPGAATVAANPLTNRPPVANNVNDLVAPGSTLQIAGLGGSDPDGTIASYTINTLPPAAQGTLFLGDPANGGVAVTAGQSLTPAQINQLFFRSTGTFSGANFTYSATDNRGASSPGTATLTANAGVNEPPLANNASFLAAPGSAVPIAGLGGSDPDGTIASYTIDTLPPAAQGVLYLGNPASGGVPITAGQVLTPAQIGQLFFQSTGTFTGTNFTYSAVDNLGLKSPAVATVAATASANLPPVATNANTVLAPGSVAPVTGLGGTDPDGTIASYTINTLPAATEGVLFLGNPASGGVAVTAGQTLTPAQIGQLFFQASGAFNGANFTYNATDNRGASSPATATLAPSTAANQPPLTNNANVAGLPGSTLPVAGLGGTDPNGTIASYTIDTLPPADQGVLFLGDPAQGGVPVTAGQTLTPAQSAQLFFRSTAGFANANFTYRAIDNLGAASPFPATVALSASANQPPVANNSNAVVAPSSIVAIRGLGGTDPDGTVASYTIDTLPPAAQGVLFLGNPTQGGVAVTASQRLTPDQIGQLFFQSAGTFTGANFNYSATDNRGASGRGTASINPLATVNQPPVATNSNSLVAPNGVVRILGLGGTDPDGTVASYTINTLPPAAQGTLFLGDPAQGGVAVTAGQTLTPEQINQLFFRST
ncbi:MAG: DUF11 domain-containing protein, partial [Oscillatoriales cyanobacterium RU_3_3]|nr:DUF11 domain-containing protein [Oscillatoriales cyanobacterium RU_3_3]